ncbi:MAG: NRDE family protein [Acidobacteriota bacterium]
MCTLSWTRRDDAVVVCMNRDERRARRPARPPIVERREGVRVVRPVDGDRGGTWIAANAHGLVLALLNGYRPAPEPRPPGAPSRGHLVEALAPAPTADAALARLERLDPTPYAPFHLALIPPPPEPSRLASWDGTSLALRALTDGDRPVVSSTVDPERVRAARRRVWARIVGAREPDAQTLERFHRSHEPERGPRSVCMHRDDARTVSFTRVTVDGDGVTMAYAGDAPCRASAREIVRIDRATR